MEILDTYLFRYLVRIIIGKIAGLNLEDAKNGVLKYQQHLKKKKKLIRINLYKKLC